MVPYQLVTQFLKTHLKTQKISQSALAIRMEIPESTLKKWLNAKDGSINRLSKICESLGLTLSGILRGIEKNEVEILQFTEEQQKYFQGNFESFKVFWFLTYERQSLEQIRINLNIREDVLKRMIYRFDKLGFVDLLSSDRLRLPTLRTVRWRPQGEFIERIFRDWSMNILNESLKKKEDLILQFFQLSEDSAEGFYKDLRRLEERYARKTIQNLSSGVPSKKRIRFLACAEEGRFFD